MKKTTILLSLFVSYVVTTAQIKIFPGGNTNVGSTTTPVSGAKLQVSGTTIFSSTTATITPTSSAYIRALNAYSTASTPDYAWSGDNTTGFFHPAANILGIATAGAERLRFHSNGCLGIGTTDPKEFIQIGDRFTFHNGGTKYLGYNSYYDGGSGTNKRIVADYASTIAFGGGDISFNIAGTGSVGSSIIFTDALRIKSDGNIGVNNSSPAYKLDVSGDVNTGTISNSYRIAGNIVLTQKNIASGIFVGNGAGAATTGANNSALGYQALNLNTSGANNTASGYQTLNKNTASGNSGFGQRALYNCTSGTPNNAFGSMALYSNTSGGNNCAFGDSALYANISATGSVAMGGQSQRNSTGGLNTSIGYKAMYANTSGTANTAVGFASLIKNTTGTFVTAMGYNTLNSSTGNYNSGYGANALFNTTSGSNNTAVGYGAGSSYTTGSNNTFIGFGADANANAYSNATALGNGAIVLGSNKVVIGNSSVTQIGGYQGWSNISDARFKTEVKEDVKGIAFIKKLRPVTFKINTQKLDEYITHNMPDSIKALHKSGTDFETSSAVVHSGFIAQEVEAAAKETGFKNSIVNTPANANDMYAMSYAEIVVPLVKAVQEQMLQIDSLKQITNLLQTENKSLQTQLNDVLKNCCQKTGLNSPARNNNETVNQQNSNPEQSNWLAQNKPNPFSKETVIEYNVVQEGKGSILIFDMNGKLLKTIPVKIPGKGSVTISGSDLTAGMYYYTLVVNDVEVDTKKMILTE